ncbi:MAG: carbohydrate ABC transporter permease [Planctomycetota bacterium]|nr:MAG: carbohydrate ABC transporter permease [Planctomycetota bacterium]
MNKVSLMILWLTLVAIALIFLAPLLYLLAASVKQTEDFHSYAFFPPIDRITLANFASLFGQMDFLRFLLNSFFVTCATVVLQLFMATLAGYALACYHFRGQKIIIIAMLVSMMIPAPVLLAPLYELLFHMRLIDTHMGLIVPGLVNVLGIFLFRQSMMGIPRDLIQAARVDGASEFGIYWHVALPVVRPMIGAFTLIAFMGTWNSFLWPQVVLQSTDLFTLPIALNQLVGLYHDDYGALMAGTLLAVLPVIALFFMLQREFISGLTEGAVKG